MPDEWIEKDREVLKSFRKNDVRAVALLWEDMVAAHEYCPKPVAVRYQYIVLTAYLRGHGVRTGGGGSRHLPLLACVMAEVSKYFMEHEYREIWFPNLVHLFPDMKALSQARGSTEVLHG